LSTDPRDLPAPGVAPKKAVTRDHLIRVAVLADPGILTAKKTDITKPEETGSTEMECKPVKVVNGRDVIDVSGKAVDIRKLLGLPEPGDDQEKPSAAYNAIQSYARHALMFFGTMMGLLLSDYIVGKVWSLFFLPSARLEQWEPLKLWIFLSIALTAAGFTDGILGLVDYSFEYAVNLISTSIGQI
jgi:hypothetical protein